MIFLLLYFLLGIATSFGVLYYYRCDYEKHYGDKTGYKPDFAEWLNTHPDPITMLIVMSGLVWPLAWTATFFFFSVTILSKYAQNLTDELYKYLNKKE